jgi:hypothetical protein
MNNKGYCDIPCSHCGTIIHRQGSLSYLMKHNVFCSFECKGLFRKTLGDIKRVELFNLGELKYRLRIKPILINRDGYKCSICNSTKWLDKDIPLQVDHIDGDASNNNSLNLRLICHNCNAILPTFAGRNRGFGRKSRGLKAYE